MVAGGEIMKGNYSNHMLIPFIWRGSMIPDGEVATATVLNLK